MKRIIIFIFIFILNHVMVFAQVSPAESWSKLDYNSKGFLLSGFILGMTAYTEFLENDEVNFISKQDAKEALNKIMSYVIANFYEENIDYWISAVDTFYYRKSNQNISSTKAFWQVLVMETISK